MIRTQQEVMQWHLAANHAQVQTVVNLAKRNNHRFTREALNMLAPQYLACNSCRTIKLVDKPVSRRLVPQSTAANQIWSVDHLRFENLGFLDANYAWVVVDDFTRYTWIFIGPRDKASFFLEHLVLHNFNMGRGIPGVINSDEAYEFDRVNNGHFAKLGIVHESVPARHRSSLGLAENSIRTLKINTKSILHHAGLPFVFWQYALHFASWHKNWMPSASHHISGSAPADLWGSGQPHWPKHWVPFGCDVSFVTGRTNAKNDDAERIAHGCFLGFDWGRIDSSALVFTPTARRVLTVPMEKLYVYPLVFSIAHLTRDVFNTLVPPGINPDSYTVSLRRLCCEVIQTGQLLPADLPAYLILDGESDPH